MSRMIDGFTTVHDIADVCMIYNDCKDYSIKVWDPETQKHYAIRFSGLELLNKTIRFELVDENDIMAVETTVEGLCGMVQAINDWISSYLKIFQQWYYDTEYKVVLTFPDNQEDKYRLVFTGSSNPDKTVHFNIVKVELKNN